MSSKAKADTKKPAKKEESESEEEYETYEYETESEEKKPAAKKDEPKKADAKPAAAPAKAADTKKKAESSEDDDEDESDEYEYETETESSEKKDTKKAEPTKAAAADAKKAEPAKAAAAAADAKKADAKKKEESSDDDDEEYEYESEYETESEEKKPEPKKDAAKPAAAAAANTAKPSAATTAKATTTTTTTTTTAAAKPAAASNAAPAANRDMVVAKKDVQPSQPWAPKNFIAEFIGTMAFSFVIYMTRANVLPAGEGIPVGDLVSQALVQGFALAAVTAAFGGISGGHFNPTVSLFLIVTRQVQVAVGLIYIIVQFAAAILGGALAWGLLDPRVSALHAGTGYAAPIACGKYPSDTASAANSCWREAFGAEIVGSFVLLLIYAMVHVSGHSEVSYLSLGFALSALVFAFNGTSNAFFNPARAIGSAAFAGNYAWDNIWVWIIGPIIGVIGAAIVWGLIFQTKEDRSKGSSLINHS